MQNYCDSLKTSYTDTLNTNSNTINNYLNLIQKNHENLKNSYLELERTNKKYKEIIQENLQEIKRQVRNNLTESLAKKTLIPILTFIGGVVVMGLLILIHHNITTPPTKDQLEHSFKMRKLKQKIENRTREQGAREREQSFQGILPTAQERELRESNAERILKQATERFNQRNRELAERERELIASKEQQDSEFRERQERVINQARESYSIISKTKQRLLEIRGRDLELERELRNAIPNAQHIISQISSFRESRESRIESINANLRTERNFAQKRFTEHVRADFTARITEHSNQRARDFTSSIQRIENTIREFRNNAQARVRTILHNLYARTRDAINAIKNIYRNAKERIRDFFQRADERLSRRMEQETRDLHAKTTQLDRKIREHNQKIENERNYSRGYGR